MGSFGFDPASPDGDRTVEVTWPTTTEIVYHWYDGSEEVRYRREYGSPEALDLMQQVLAMKRAYGDECCYSVRHV